MHWLPSLEYCGQIPRKPWPQEARRRITHPSLCKQLIQLKWTIWSGTFVSFEAKHTQWKDPTAHSYLVIGALIGDTPWPNAWLPSWALNVPINISPSIAIVQSLKQPDVLTTTVALTLSNAAHNAREIIACPPTNAPSESRPRLSSMKSTSEMAPSFLLMYEFNKQQWTHQLQHPKDLSM